jgi:hypothetical protein
MLATNFVGCCCAFSATVALMSDAINVTILLGVLGFAFGVGTIYGKVIEHE